MSFIKLALLVYHKGCPTCTFRDKIQEKFVELLAKASARSELIKTLNDVDESCQCGSPGKVMDAEVLHHVLKAPANQRVFYGQGEKTSPLKVVTLSERHSRESS